MIRENKKVRKIFNILKFEEVKQQKERQLEDFKTFYNIISNNPSCDADKKVKINIYHTRENLTDIVCDKEAAQRILDLIKKDVEKELKEAEEDLKRAEKELMDFYKEN